jgi:hypothetical protein
VDEDKARSPLQRGQRALDESDLGGPGSDQRMVVALSWVAKFGASEAARHRVANWWHAKENARQQVSHATRERGCSVTPSHQAGLPQHSLADRVALDTIGLEDVVVGAVEHRGDLPG